MLRKRIIFTLIFADGKFNQSRNFRLQKVGDSRWLERNYKFQETAHSIDELVILNATKSDKDINVFSKTLSEVVKNVFIPVAAGGGIKSLEDAETLFLNGADKLVVNSALYDDEDLINALVQRYGSQSVVACVDCKLSGSEVKVFIRDGSYEIPMSLNEYIRKLQSLKVGEIYLNSIDRDGTGFGYDIELIDNTVLQDLTIPLIIAGGAGNEDHLIEGLNRDHVDAVATANLFNFVGDGLSNARKKIIDSNLNVARWI